MAISKKQETELYDLALKYHLDGNSLDKAQALAEKKYLGSLKTKGKMTLAQQEQLNAKLLAKSKTLAVRLKRIRIKNDRDEVAENKKKLAKIEADDKRSNAKRQADRKKTLAGGFDNFPKKIGTIASYGGAIVVINKIVQAFTFAIEKTIEFEKAFTDLQVKSGYSKKEMAEVSETIIDVAQSTKFATEEIISASTALGKLGFKSTEVAQILPNLANVAAATGESLENTAQILGKVIRAYEYSAEQSGIISDRMVDIFNNSALNLEKFNTAFSYVGSAAASTGTSFNELTAAMAILADRGITASKIGTGLRNVFTKLGNEGDSLRDILERINDAHLSFYEVAELVGRRAANQLFIMANSLDEFDENVARSTEDFGKSMEAAALQMGTFSAKFDILKNTIANWFLPDFDPNDTWKDQMRDSIGLMDMLNSAFSDTNAKAAVNRVVLGNPKFVAEFKAMKEALGGDKNDKEVLEALRKQEAKKQEKYGRNSKDWRSSGEYQIALTDLGFVSGQTSVTDSLLGNDMDKKSDESQRALLKWQKTVERVHKKLTEKFGAERGNNFIQNLFGGEEYEGPEKKSFLERLANDGVSEEDRDQIEKTANYNWTQRNKERLKYRVAGLGTYGEELEKSYKGIRAKITDLNDGKLLVADNEGKVDYEKIVGEDIERVKKAINKEKEIRDTICSEAPRLASKLGIVCDKAKTTRKRGEFEKFDAFTDDDSEYKVEKSKLGREFRQENDPLKKAGINNQLIALETEYRASLNKRFEDYLDKMGNAREAYAKKYPSGIGAYDANIERVGDNQTRADATGQINMDNLANVEIEQLAKKYKQQEVAKAEHSFKMKVLNKEFKNIDRDDVKARRAKIAEALVETNSYYDKTEEDLKGHIKEVEDLLAKTELSNFKAKFTGDITDPFGGIGTVVGTDNIKQLLSVIQAELFKLKEKREAEKIDPKKTDTDEWDWDDYFGAGLETYENVTSFITQIGDLKLELLKEQAQRELEIIQARYDDEASVRDSALQSGIISQETAIRAEERANKRKIDNENKINKKLFEAQKKQDKQTAIFTGIASTAQAVANAFAKRLPATAIVLSAISAAAIAGSTALNIAAISKRKFIPQKYAEGGMVHGRSHSQGGVPFSVNGSGGYEMEGGEYIVNKEATKNNIAELERINGKTRRSQTRFASGGYVAERETNDEILALIAENLNKPVRAYVTDQDLETSISEREALTKKISY